MTPEGRDLARLALATIRSVNGLAALLMPKAMLRRLQVDPEQNGAAIYALRLFGIRTAILGAALFLKRGDEREKALRTGVIIHGSDAASAFVSWTRGYLPRRAGAVATLISCVNTVLAIVAQDRSGTGERARTGAEAWVD